MQSYGLGTMPYLDWFCSVEGDPLPRTLSGLHLGLGKGGGELFPEIWHAMMILQCYGSGRTRKEKYEY